MVSVTLYILFEHCGMIQLNTNVVLVSVTLCTAFEHCGKMVYL